MPHGPGSCWSTCRPRSSDSRCSATSSCPSSCCRRPDAAGFGFGLGILEAGLWMIPPTLVGVAMAPSRRAITRYGAWTTHC
ncbi:hypothetical protein GS425_05230 [Rhodococcus hoagii]|nr:hypothetical protein [Prescottella equi]